MAVGAAWVLILIAAGSSNVPPIYALYIVLVPVMIYIRHWKNIQNLLAGRERRLGERAN